MKQNFFSDLDVIFRCIPTSFQARQLIQQHGLVLSDLETDPRFFIVLRRNNLVVLVFCVGLM